MLSFARYVGNGQLIDLVDVEVLESWYPIKFEGRQLRSGTVGVNGTGNMHVSAPFGGVGISGFGREGGLEGIREFAGTKTVLMG